MKILVYGINFTPEPTGAGKYTGEMVQSLVALGHEVRVIAAPPYYPAWKVQEGFANAYGRTDMFGAKVWRAPLWVPPTPSGTTRVLHLLSFAMTSFPLLLRQLVWRPDVVMVVVPAFACAPGTWLMARLCGAKCWIHVQDYEVDAAFRLGLLKGKVPRFLISTVERWLFRRFDRVSSISVRMLDRALRKGVKRERVVSFPNWVDISAIEPLQGTSPYRAELGLAPTTKVALFSGTLAGKQGLDLLPQAARLMAQWGEDITIVICGDGQMKPELLAASEGLANVRFMPLQPYERLSQLLGMATVHLLPQNPDAADLVMPSKLTGMLASGRPVVCTADDGTELQRVVSQCGVVVPPGSPEGLAKAIVKLANDPERCAALGAEARRYAEQFLSRHGVMKHLNNCLEHCVEPRKQPLLDPMNP